VVLEIESREGVTSQIPDTRNLDAIKAVQSSKHEDRRSSITNHHGFVLLEKRRENRGKPHREPTTREILTRSKVDPKVQ
jgi:hypothetical protein